MRASVTTAVEERKGLSRGGSIFPAPLKDGICF